MSDEPQDPTPDTGPVPPVESSRPEVEARIQADLAALKDVMDVAVGGGQSGGTVDDQLRALEEMHRRLQDLTAALQKYAREEDA